MKTTVLILCGLFSAMSTLSALPAAAADLKAKRDAKVAEIDRVYAAELDKLQRRLMADGNLASANEVEDEIKRVTVNPFADEKISTAALLGKWMRNTDKNVFVIHDGKTGTHHWTSGTTDFKVSLNPEKSQVTISAKKWSNTLSFDPKAGVLSNVDGSYTLKKVQ